MQVTAGIKFGGQAGTGLFAGSSVAQVHSAFRGIRIMGRNLVCLALLLLTTAGCGRSCPSIAISNQSPFRIHVSRISDVGKIERRDIPPGATVQILSTRTALPDRLTVTWYVRGPHNHLPAIKDSVIVIPPGGTSAMPLVLTLSSNRKWIAEFKS